MNKYWPAALLLLMVFILAGCSSTSISLRTEPSDANVKFYSKEGMIYEGRSNIYNYQIDKRYDEQVFKDLKQAQLGFVIEKQGYRPLFGIMSVLKGQEIKPNTIKLDNLNTEISFDVDPPGAKAILYPSIEDARKDKGMRNKGRVVSIPLGESFGGNYQDYQLDQFPDLKNKYNSQIHFETDYILTLPWKQSYTEETARAELTKVKAIRLEAEDYVPEIKEVSIRPGQSTVIAYKLKKMVTTLKVLSEPDGVEIEDTTKGENYGYLGKAPLARQFSYQEAIRDRNREDNKVHLTLRASKPGFVDQRVEVAVPWGEEQTVKVTLKPRSSQISFQSDPDGVHVYVKRKKKDTRFDKAKGEWAEDDVPVLKHLGTTPFTYYMDPEDPLEHNDELVFKKTGYKDNDDRFAVGVNTYHKVMTPEVIKER